MNNLSFRINFSYRIGKMSVDARPKRRRTINNDDLKDGGGGDGMEGGGGGGQPQQQRSGGGPATKAAPSSTKNADAKSTPTGDPAAVVKAEGSWNYTVESPQGGEGVLNIKKEGDAYSGSITNKRFNAETPLSSITVNGNELTFQYDITRQDGNQMNVQVKSIITGDTLAGDMSVGQFGTFPIKATRAQ